jgi:hypothetical protein
MTYTATNIAMTFGLRVQPMVHVENMSESVAFFETLGGQIAFGSRDADWTLMQFQGSSVSLLAHPPGDGRFETVELHFTASSSLEELEAHVKSINPVLIDRGVGDEAFGKMLKLKTPDGLLIKIVELEREVIE